MAAGSPHILLRLLLCSVVIRSSLLVPDQGYDVVFPCGGDLFCLHMWRSARDFIAVATNGRIQTRSETRSGCRLPIMNRADGVVLRRFCQRGTGVPFPQQGIPEINLVPGRSASLQCVLLSQDRSGGCSNQQVRLRWRTGDGDGLHADSERQYRRDSACNVTLTVTFKRPGITQLECRATASQRIRTSALLRVKVQALKGKGRVLIAEPEPEKKPPETVSGGSQDVISTAVGAVGCAVLIALVAAFVARRRRTRNQLPAESESPSSNNDSHADDVIYADVILPDGSGQMLIHEDTEYACIRHVWSATPSP